jgi:anti-sigma factor RsiW
MSQNTSLEEKIIRLVLSELSHTAEGERLSLPSQDPALSAEVMQLIKRIENLAKGTSALVNEGENESVTAPPACSRPCRKATAGRD